ncbi:MAG: COG4705 family protein [Janthinobacterium lividum]
MAPTSRAARTARTLPPKVPEITAIFWVLKVLTTGMGEAASDYLGDTSLVLGGVVGVGGFALALWLQLRSERYHAPTYWFCVAAIAVFGTIVADVLHVATGLSYYVTSAFYAAVVAALFIWWRRSEATIDIHSITTPRRERFYWATVIATFALGTAVGDLTGLTLHLGFFPAGLVFLVAIAIPYLAFRRGANPVVTFWAAYVLTRPLGASFADWVAKEHSVGGGLGAGDATVTVVALVLIVILVGYVTVRRHGIQNPARTELDLGAGRPPRESR